MNSTLFQINNITFAYPKNPPLFQDFSFEIKQDDKILLLEQMVAAKAPS